MNICINCGKENKEIICNKCKNKIDIEELCREIINYNYEEGKNPNFELIANEKGGLIEFKNIVLELAEDIKSPKKEMLIIDALTCNKKYWQIKYNKKDIFYKSAEVCLKSNKISEKEKDEISCILLSCKLKEHQYKEVEEIANRLKNKDDLNKKIYYILCDFYIQTRRYDLAKYYIEKRKEKIDKTDDKKIRDLIQDKSDEIEKRKKGQIKEYIPASEENQKKYRTFMKSIGKNIDAQNNIPKKLTRKDIEKIKIRDEDYPTLKENEIKNDNFNSFVAFDLETTGFGQYDEIIEIGAIRVINGKIDESKKFTFQELVHPDKKKISEEVETVTGITNEMVKNKERIWEVFPRFMEFVKDDILVGYNCMSFDRRFLRKAGRYSNIVIKNKIYDVMTSLKSAEIEKMQLTEISKKLKVENETCHRALADAITTARVFIKLKELDIDNKKVKPSKTKVTRINIIGGRNQQSDNIQEIWENLIDDCNNNEEKIIKKILKINKENIEKPIYNANVEISNTNDKITVNEIWKKSKVMLFLEDNMEAFNKVQNTGWKCYILNKKFKIEEFLKEIEI